MSMFIYITSIILSLFFSSVCFAQNLSITQIQGSFRPAKTLNKVVFVSAENRAFTPQESIVLDNWLKHRFKASQFNYNNLEIYFNSDKDVAKNVRGCFNSWFKNLETASRLALTEHFKPNGLYVLSKIEIDQLSADLVKYTSANLTTCKEDVVLGDITTAFIAIELDRYLSDKLHNMQVNSRYNDILEKVFEAQVKKIGWEQVMKLSTWLDDTQALFPLLTPDVLEKYILAIKSLNDKKISESEAAFILIEALSLNSELLKEIVSEHNKALPYVQAASLLYEKCFVEGKFNSEKCDISNIGKNLIFIKQNRRTKTLSHVMWVQI